MTTIFDAHCGPCDRVTEHTRTTVYTADGVIETWVCRECGEVETL